MKFGNNIYHNNTGGLFGNRSNGGIMSEIKDSFKSGSNLTKLIYINIAVFVIVKLIYVVLYLTNTSGIYGYVSDMLVVPASLPKLVYRFWTVITYMFFHEGFLHILFNILWLYWFGKIFLMYFNEKQLLSTYLLGGLSGAALFILAYNVFPVFQSSVAGSAALGASAAVMAIGIGAATYMPNFTLNLLLIGPVKLKYLALVLIITDIIQIPSSNPGGHIAHLGGALFGVLFASQYKKGKDISKRFSRFMDSVFSMFKPGKKMKVTYKNPSKKETDYEYNNRKKAEQENIDYILDKISKSGYDSLTKAEKEKLFKMGR